MKWVTPFALGGFSGFALGRVFAALTTQGASGDYSDLAAMAGIARENVDSILTDWEDRKVISQNSGYYCIESKSVLQREIHL